MQNNCTGRSWRLIRRTSPRNICWACWRRRRAGADEALERIAAALKINPGDAGALINYGNVLSLQGRFAEAVASYDRALASDPMPMC